MGVAIVEYNVSMRLQTRRLLLREFTWDDFEPVYAYESEPRVLLYVCYGPYTAEECRQVLAFHIAQQSADPRMFYHLAVVTQLDNRLIGWCGLEISDRANQEGEIGYALHPNYWGRGYATEAAQAMLQFGFERLKFHRIFGTCHPANHGSIRVLQKLGMRYEGHLREQKQCRGYWRDTVIYALLDHEWRSKLSSPTT